METVNKECFSKKGISLVVLLITIIVALIILSAATIKILDASENATLSSFADELRTLEDASKEYYLQNNELPVSNLDNSMNVSELLNLNLEDSSKISEELGLNSDNLETTKFYRLDLSKLNVTSTTRGVMKKGNEKDIYVIAYPSFRIYYLQGMEAKKIKFFSLSTKMSGVNNINVDISNVVVENVNTQVIGGINVVKDTDDYTSSIGVTISTNIENYEQESVFVSLGNNSQVKLNINQNGFFSIKINNINQIYSSSTDIENFNKLSAEEKYMEIIKKKSDVEVARVKVDLSNYDNSLPYIVKSSVNLKKNNSTNTLYFDVSDIPLINDITIQNGVSSGIKEVRYEYLTKYNEEKFIEENYYTNASDFSDSYMKSEAKKANISNSGTVKIDLPKEIIKIKVIVLDNASNYTIYEQNTLGGTKIGYALDSFNENYLKINLKVYADESISSGSVSISNDGINFIQEKNFSNIEPQNVYNISLEYNNVIQLNNFVYFKVIVNKVSGIEEKILKIDLNM